MTWQAICAAVLVLLGVGIELASCLGVLIMEDVWQRLHFMAPATILGPLALAVAVILEESLSTSGIKALLIFVVLAATSPVLTHATARVARMRRYGSWHPQPGEHVEEL